MHAKQTANTTTTLPAKHASGRVHTHNIKIDTTEIRDEIKMIRENIGLRRSRKLQQLKHVVSMNNYDIINH